jgi:predicted dehydrogenase
MAQRIHLPNFATIAGCDLIALAALRRALGEKVQRRFDIPRLYRDHRELVADPDVDAVGVSARQSLQGEIARECLAAGKHVFMEKPMAISIAAAEAILAAAHRAGARLMIAYMKRFDGGYELAREIVQNLRLTGELGEITQIRVHAHGGDPGWSAWLDAPPIATSDEPRVPGPVPDHAPPSWLPAERTRSYVDYLQTFCHNVNVLRFILEAGDRARVKYADLNADGFTGVVLLDVDGTRAVMETGWLRHHRWDEHVQIYFERGWVKVTAAPNMQLNAPPSDVEVYRIDQRGETGHQRTLLQSIPEPNWTWHFRREAVHFIECLKTGAPFRTSAEDALTDVRLMEEIYRTWLQV